jgi:ABC-2 type transport system ATP-binding protein
MGQKVSLYAGLSLRENVEFYAGLYGLEPDQLEQRWGAVRERFGLASAEQERPENLPAAVRQRAGLALATLHAPRLLFLDEPTAGVDVESRGLFWELIQDASDQGVTVFVTTHFLEEADYCDQVAFIEAGKLVADTTPEGLRARYSSGYRIEARLAPGARERVLAELTRAGFAAEAQGDQLVASAPSLAPEQLALLSRALGPESAASLHIQQASMNDVFRRLVHEGAGQAAAAGGAP